MDVARVALLPGLCLASRIPFQVCAMLGLTPCAQLDFCRKFFNALAPPTKLRHCRRQSSSLFCMHSDSGLGCTLMQSGVNASRSPGTATLA